MPRGRSYEDTGESGETAARSESIASEQRISRWSRRGSEASHRSTSRPYYGEMAHDEVFDGPISESVPSSIASFVRRRHRQDSSASSARFKFFTEEEVEKAQDATDYEDLLDEDLLNEADLAYHHHHQPSLENNEEDNDRLERVSLISQRSGSRTPRFRHHPPRQAQSPEASDEEDIGFGPEEIESGAAFANWRNRRRSSSRSSYPVDIQSNFPLMHHQKGDKDIDGAGSTTCTQKYYLRDEDMTIVIAGYKTSRWKTVLFLLASICSVGIIYLIFRWFPRLKLKLTSNVTPLGKCDWVVVENHWGELSFHNIEKLRYNRPLHTVFASHDNIIQEPRSQFDEGYEGDQSNLIIKHLHILEYRYTRFIYHPLQDSFMLNADWRDYSWDNAQSVAQGIDNHVAEDRKLVFGSNDVDIKEKSMWTLLVDEVLHPFYVFQIASILLWSLDEYYYYAACIFIISVGSVGSNLVETKQTMHRLKNMSRHVCDVRVLRNGFWNTLDSTELVPGDVYELSDPSLQLFPCDSILLAGDCIVNESMLTGESVPVSKTALSYDQYDLLTICTHSIPSQLTKHFLYSGTKIIRVRPPLLLNAGEDENSLALAMVIRTGFNTTKGGLVRSMMFPKPSKFKFYQDSFRYIGFMFIVAAIGFISCLVSFIRMGLPTSLIIFRALDIITIVVPPALPATLSIGTSFALARLRSEKIFCISPNRVNVGGKIDVVCFDKTGTLTEDGLDVFGVQAVINRNANSPKLGNLLKSVRELNEQISDGDQDSLATLNTMTTCHSLKLVDGTLIGDPLDFKMFSFTGWTYEEEGHQFLKPHRDSNVDERIEDDDLVSNKLSPATVRPPVQAKLNLNDESVSTIDADPSDASVQPESEPREQEHGLDVAGDEFENEIAIMRSFEFVAQLRRMSVVVKKFGQKSHMTCYVKGAPEIMKDICIPESFPKDFEEQLHFYTHHGYRVIACASKTIKLTWLKAQKIKREQVECNLEFNGFIIFENKLKPSTAGAIKELSDAAIRNIMVTGDNVLTAISVGRKCGLVSSDAIVVAPHFYEPEDNNEQNHNNENGHDNRNEAKKVSMDALQLRWTDVDNEDNVLDSRTLEPIGEFANNGSGVRPNISLAITGDAFRWLMDEAPSNLLGKVLIMSSVFARMSPDEKQELVEKLQSIDYSVGFCGDGANDCGALKAADVGVSLSEAEASVAAPFTSRVFEISCYPQVIREGRAALVTSFSCFKYMSTYSAIQFITVSLLYNSGTNLGDFQFLLIDLAINIPLAIFMAWSKPYPILCKKKPTANLVSPKVLTSLVGEILIYLVFQMIIFFTVEKYDWFIPSRPGSGDEDVWGSENTSLFLTGNYQYLFSAMILTIGPPYRQRAIENIPFVATVGILLVMCIYLTLIPDKISMNVLQLTYMSFGFKEFILLLMAINLVCLWVADRYILVNLAKFLQYAKIHIFRGKPKARKRYKIIREEQLALRGA